MSAGSPLVRRKARTSALVAALGLSASLGLVAPGLSTGSANAAPPAPNPVDCPTATPLDSLSRGEDVTALSVSQGTTPDEYAGSVLGVLKDALGPGRDLIMIDFTTPDDPDNEIDRAGGIWAGMSGSPVYAPDGTLIGSISYGLAWSSTTVAGVTPYGDMAKYLGPATAPSSVNVTPKMAQRIASTGAATETQAAQGLEALPVPMSISGVRAGRLDAGEKKRAYMVKSTTRAGTSSSADAAGADTVEAGGNLAAVFSTGDVTYAGVGTVTAVCNGRIVGFGHPMDAVGDTSYGLAAADVVYVQKDPLGGSYKASNIGDVVGTIDSDRLSGIAGDIGPVPASTAVTSTVNYGDGTRTGETNVYVPDALASVAFYGVLGNHDAVLDHYGKGSESQGWVIEGTDENGAPFTIDYTDVYQSSYDIAVEGSYPLADTLWALTQAGATVTSVRSTADVSDDDSQLRVKRVEQKVDGEWVNVTRDTAKVDPGTDLKLRALVTGGDTDQYVDWTIAIPAKLAGARGYVRMFGGGSDWLNVYGLDSTQEVIDALDNDPSNASVAGQIRIDSKNGKFSKKLVSREPQFDLVVNGDKFVSVKVTGSSGGSDGGLDGGCSRIARGC